VTQNVDASAVHDAAPSRTGAPSPVLLGLVGLVGFAGLVELLPRTGLVKSEYFPPTSAIAEALWQMTRHQDFWIALRQTAKTWSIGLGIVIVAGIVLGLVIGSIPFLRTATSSTVEFLRPIPSVALIPLVVVLLGNNMWSTMVLVVYAAFWQVLIQVLYGVADVDPVASETARSYRLGGWYRMRYLVLPTTLPYAMTGIRLATTVALILTVTGEFFIGGTPGLGRQIDVAYSSGAVPAMYGLVVVTGLIGVLANLVTGGLEKLVLAWHPAIRKDVVA
jgi:ABC-type nitrate/sulfonate/bicarbonate transport system permease component